MIFRAKKKEEVEEDMRLQNFFFVEGDLWTDYPFDVTELDPRGIVLHVRGDVYLGVGEPNVTEGGIWIPRDRLPSKIKDIVAYSGIFNYINDLRIKTN